MLETLDPGRQIGPGPINRLCKRERSPNYGDREVIETEKKLESRTGSYRAKKRTKYRGGRTVAPNNQHLRGHRDGDSPEEGSFAQTRTFRATKKELM